MKNLKSVLEEARSKKVAVGHFNVSDLVALKAIFEAAKGLGLPVMIGVSEGERAFLGVRTIAAAVKNLRDEFDYPIFLNADHTHSLEKAIEAAKAGFDEVIVDFSDLSFEENVKKTKEAIAILKDINSDLLIEGEIGYIGKSSEILEAKPANIYPTVPEEAAEFVKETGIDILAPSVGNMHGLLKSMVEGTEHKHLDIPRIKAIGAATGGIHMTLHGGSGTGDNDFVSAIESGMDIIHINSDIRVAWRKGLEEGLFKEVGEIAPYKILIHPLEAVKKSVEARLKLFNRI